MKHKIDIVAEDPRLKTRLLAALHGSNLDINVTESPDSSRLWQAPSDTPDLVLLSAQSSAEIDHFLAVFSRHKVPGTQLLWVVDGATLEHAEARIDERGDEFLTDPFSPAEVRLRVLAVLSRTVGARNEPLRVGPIEIDQAEHAIRVHNDLLHLAPAEFRLLAFFLYHRGCAFSRKELLKGAWGSGVHAGERTVDVHIRRLRKLLEPFGCAQMIQTVRGVGYRFSETKNRQQASRTERSKPSAAPFAVVDG